MKTKSMPYRDLWQNHFASSLGVFAANNLMNLIQNKYYDLRAKSEENMHKLLKKHLYGNIFPQMAVYLTLIEDTSLSENALLKVQELHILTLHKDRKNYETLGKLPFSYPLLRISTPFSVKSLTKPPSGWKMELVENGSNSIYVKVHTCFYNEIMKKYNVPELISIYCNGDEYVYREVDVPYIEFDREKSFARGDDYCDIIFNKKHRN